MNLSKLLAPPLSRKCRTLPADETLLCHATDSERSAE